MKPKSTLRSYLLLAGSSLLAVSSLPAATFYWDNNGTTAGFGNAGGTWAQNNTSGGTAARWKTDVAGTAAGSATQVTTDADIFNFGTATSGLGAGTITVSGSVTMGDTFYGAASGAVVLSGGTAINFGAAKTITVNNTTNTIATPIGGAATSLTKAGSGALLLTGANTYTGTTIINGGTIDLGGGTATGSLASTALTLGGGALSYTRTGSTTQGFTATNFNAGGVSQISAVSGNTLNLGTVARGTAGTIDFANVGAGTVAAETASNDATGIMAGLTLGDSWAVANGAGVAISALPNGSYTLSSAAGTTGASYIGNVDVDNNAGALDAFIAANSLRFSAAAANTLTLTGTTNTLTSGGILVGSGVGANLSTITGGTLAGADTKDLGIIQNNTGGGLTISSVIGNNTGATALKKSGAGLLTLGNSNTFTGGVFIYGGNITLANAGALNSTPGSENAVAFGAGTTGTLTLNGNSVVVRNLFTNATPGTAVVENASATPITLTIGNSGNASGTFAGIIQDGTGSGALALTKAGTGTLTLSGANTYTGGTTLTAGTVAISNATALGSGAISVTGNSRINAAALTYANDISVAASTVLSVQNTGAANSTATFSGAVTGSGGVTLVQGTNSGTTIALSSANNTFTGNVTLPTGAGANDFISFGSIGDGGSIVFGRPSWRSAATYTGAAGLEFNTRTISLATTFGGTSGLDGGGNPINMFANSGAGTVTINTAMGMTSIASSGFLFLGGTNTGNNTFAGAIADPTGANTLGIGKWDAGKWILSNNTNSFEGKVFLAAGTLSVGVIDVSANAQPLGKGSLIQLGYRNADTGTLEYTGSTNAVTDKQIELGQLANSTNGNFAGGGVILNNGLGTLTFSNSTFNSTTGVPVSGTGVNRTLTLGGTNTGDNTISGTIQDNNTTIGARLLLAKTGAGTWTLSGTNTYTGGTTIGNNTQNVGTLNITNGSALGTGAVSIVSNTGSGNPAALTLNSNTGITVANNFTTSGTGQGNNGIIRNVAGNNEISGTITLASGGGDTRIQSDGGSLTLSGTLAPSTTARILRLSGSAAGLVSGAINDGAGANTLAGLIKEGAGIWTLSGVNNYTGATTVSGGTLALSSTGSIASSSSVSIGAAGTLDTSAQATYTIPGAQPLAFGISATGSGSSGKIVAAALDISSAVVTYNITGTPDDPVYVLATYSSLTGTPTFASVDPAPTGYTLNYAYEGNKIALVSTGAPAGFAAWQSANSTAGGRDEDHDGDGVDNGTEHFLGGTANTTGFTALPSVVKALDGTLSVTWTKAGTYTGTYGTDFTVETSATLSGSWTTETLGVNVTITGNDVKYTFPGGPAYSGKNFARLKVTGP